MVACLFSGGKVLRVEAENRRQEKEALANHLIICGYLFHSYWFGTISIPYVFARCQNTFDMILPLWVPGSRKISHTPKSIRIADCWHMRVANSKALKRHPSYNNTTTVSAFATWTGKGCASSRLAVYSERITSHLLASNRCVSSFLHIILPARHEWKAKGRKVRRGGCSKMLIRVRVSLGLKSKDGKKDSFQGSM